VNIPGAIVAGLIGTVVMSIALLAAPQMNLPKMDFAGILAALVGLPRVRAVGFGLHALLGVLWALGYAAVWATGILPPNVTTGALLGIVHWLIAGALLGLLTFLRPGGPGFYLRGQGGGVAFFGGLMAHVVYGLTVGLVYEFLHL
jgi:hypothetical protein